MIANSGKTNFDIILKVVFLLLLNRGEIKDVVLATPGELVTTLSCFCFVCCCCVVVVAVFFFSSFFFVFVFFFAKVVLLFNK